MCYLFADEAAKGKPNPLARLLGSSKKAAGEAKSAAHGAQAAAQRGTKKVASRAKAAAASAASAGDRPAEKKKGGFLQSLGIGQETFYADED